MKVVTFEITPIAAIGKVAEWLRRGPAKPVGSPRVGSSFILVD